MNSNKSAIHTYTNALINESSPYLLQHAHNPVDWHAWNEESFKRAEQLDKPVFLSIGYSTCHWCHVMENESFKDPELAALMNEVFINIKVDREERPDIDTIYMEVCQMMTRSGGWPLTIMMTPDKKPFFAATYIPKEDRFGRAGMFSIIRQVDDMWKNKRPDILKSANEITQALKQGEPSGKPEELQKENAEIAFKHLMRRYDPEYGGFGKRPKFPSPHQLLFLLRYSKETNEKSALEMVTRTLKQMRYGGIYDHLGFGFHRYSTDAQWKVPHFEKMLYNQGMLALAYLEAFQVTREPLFSQTAEEILTYVERNMTSPYGGFFSAEDADSEGEEGTFYLWSEAELQEILSEAEFKQVQNYFNTAADGNFLEESTGRQTGKNILFRKGEGPDIKPGSIEKIRQKLFTFREKREHPFKDDKILTDWNGLMLAAFAKAARVLEKAEFLQIARNNIQFIQQHMTDENNHLKHRYRLGQADIPGNLDDYAFYIFGLLETYTSAFNTEYLEQAIRLTDILIEQFMDKETAKVYLTPADGEKLLIRPQNIYDSAIPSGLSMTIHILLTLGKITGEIRWEAIADRMLKQEAVEINRMPAGMTMLLSALHITSEQSMEIVIVGEPEQKEIQQFLSVIFQRFIPAKVVLFKSNNTAEPLSRLAPFTRNYHMIDHKPTVYVCRNYQCHQPVTTLDELLKLLK